MKSSVKWVRKLSERVKCSSEWFEVVATHLRWWSLALIFWSFAKHWAIPRVRFLPCRLEAVEGEASGACSFLFIVVILSLRYWCLALMQSAIKHRPSDFRDALKTNSRQGFRPGHGTSRNMFNNTVLFFWLIGKFFPHPKHLSSGTDEIHTFGEFSLKLDSSTLQLCIW